MSKVFVSFDFEHDKQYKYLLDAWNSNTGFDFVYEDGTPKEINSINVGRIKAGLTSKIKEAYCTLVVVGEHSNDPHPQRNLIGYKNWINFEVAQSIALGKRIGVVKIKHSNTSPEELAYAEKYVGTGFTRETVLEVIRNAPINY